MTSADERRPLSPQYPWHQTAQPRLAGRSPSAVLGARAGLVTRALANVADLFVVGMIVAGCYLAVAAIRFLTGPVSFEFPAPSLPTLLVLVLSVQALYFTVTWAVVEGTYGDRLLNLRVCRDRGVRLGWGGCAVRAVLCTIFPIGLLWVPLSRDNRSVQDVVLRTTVVYG